MPGAGPNTVSLTLYYRQHCHLCDEMRSELERARRRLGFELEVCDIDADEALVARYSHKVPVLAAGEEEICHHFLDETALAGFLRGCREEVAGGAGALRDAPLYERIYAVVRRIPAGRLATYGQVAAIEGHCTPRTVGYALAALRGRRDVPWQRVINHRGTVSERRAGGGTARQRRLLEAEGVVFDRAGRADFAVYGWSGPDWQWLEANGFFSAPPPSRT